MSLSINLINIKIDISLTFTGDFTFSENIVLNQSHKLEGKSVFFIQWETIFFVNWWMVMVN